MSTLPAMKLYGVPLSQPCRSVAWTMLQLQLHFEVEMAVPGMKSKMGTKHENFQSLTPHRSAHVPLLKYTMTNTSEEVTLSESPAILTHLCEFRHSNMNDSADIPSLYPPSGSFSKAKVDSYLHWHDSNTRRLARIFQTKVRPDLNVSLSDEDHEQAQTLLQTLETGWIPYGEKSDSSKLFIGGLDQPSIADILAYGELSAVTMTNLLDVSSSDFPLLQQWMKNMAELPHHDAAHKGLTTLGDLANATDPKDVSKRLGAATKDGLQGFTDAQSDYKKS